MVCSSTALFAFGLLRPCWGRLLALVRGCELTLWVVSRPPNPVAGLWIIGVKEFALS